MEKDISINRHVIENIDEEIRSEVLEIFLEDAHIAVVELNTALKSEDFESIRQYAHKIKGASMFAGAIELSKECMLLEKNCKEESFNLALSIQKVTRLIDELDVYLRENFLDKK